MVCLGVFVMLLRFRRRLRKAAVIVSDEISCLANRTAACSVLGSWHNLHVHSVHSGAQGRTRMKENGRSV